MSTDYKALCAELANHLQGRKDLECGWPGEDPEQDLLDRARAELAQPEPAAPTDEEIEEWADAASEAPLEEMDPEIYGWRRCFTKEQFGASIREALACWGTPAIQPVPVSERLPGPEDCDSEGRCWMFDPCDRGRWCYREALPSDGDPEPFTHRLPHHALPMPAPANNTREENLDG
jgi:hypothetical protein